MSKPKRRGASAKQREPYRVRLPGFINDKDVGLGDAIKRVTYAFGIRPCEGCERRAAALNRRLVFPGTAVIVGPVSTSRGGRTP
jgi:hypothetical protein